MIIFEQLFIDSSTAWYIQLNALLYFFKKAVGV